MEEWLSVFSSEASSPAWTTNFSNTERAGDGPCVGGSLQPKNSAKARRRKERFRPRVCELDPGRRDYVRAQSRDAARRRRHRIRTHESFLTARIAEQENRRNALHQDQTNLAQQLNVLHDVLRSRFRSRSLAASGAEMQPLLNSARHRRAMLTEAPQLTPPLTMPPLTMPPASLPAAFGGLNLPGPVAYWVGPETPDLTGPSAPWENAEASWKELVSLMDEDGLETSTLLMEDDPVESPINMPALSGRLFLPNPSLPDWNDASRTVSAAR
jgi:hypothetical protein